MPGSLTLSAGTLYSFLLVLARVGGSLVFVPLPGIRGGPEPARVALAVGFTMALFGRWPHVDAPSINAVTIAAWVATEAALGLAIGVSLATVIEALVLAAQVLGLQAGYAYASTIDPNSDADSAVLQVFTQLMAGMLFFTLGLDREVLRLFALSLEKIPVGTYTLGATVAEGVIRLAAGIFSVGMRLAFPIVGLLILVDVALALVGRLNQQLQLLSLAFPVKMLVALAMLSWLAVIFPRMLISHSGTVWMAVRRVFGI